ncbi:hypothetical protein SCE1572_13195 [Sorangium cellulosum So0157-2]|uniref:Uncharacterized protein n=1 Tax=Sorangium cellulosum So0157-2 TaxID=1254432 RepID=S4XU32_SORCE|nr:hypothetical protein SCE1572_13195 [Sorangium cellulosum So0157-2]
MSTVYLSSFQELHLQMPWLSAARPRRGISRRRLTRVSGALKSMNT